MRRFGLILSIVFMLSFCYLGGNVLSESKLLSSRSKYIGAELGRIQDQIDSISKYEDSEVKKLKDGYSELYNQMMLIALYNGVSCNVSIPGSKDRVNIEDYFTDSVFVGISVVNLEVDFGKVNEIGEYTSILESVYDLQRSFPYEIVKVEKQKDSLLISLNLYGM